MRSTASAATRVFARWRSERGSAPAEWALVASLLTLVFLTVLQLGFAMYVRTVATDAAAEGARYAGLVGADLAAGEARARDVLERSLTPEYAEQVSAHYTDYLGVPAVEVVVVAPLPLVGLLGLPDAMEVKGHAPREELLATAQG